jgi:hypothetical protein
MHFLRVIKCIKFPSLIVKLTRRSNNRVSYEKDVLVLFEDENIRKTSVMRKATSFADVIHHNMRC